MNLEGASISIRQPAGRTPTSPPRPAASTCRSAATSWSRRASRCPGSTAAFVRSAPTRRSPTRRSRRDGSSSKRRHAAVARSRRPPVAGRHGSDRLGSRTPGTSTPFSRRIGRRIGRGVHDCERGVAVRAPRCHGRDALITSVRAQPLGAVIGSTPALMDAPSLDPPPDDDYGFPDSTGTFAGDHKDRRSILFFGANDGMIHAVDAQDGISRCGRSFPTTCCRSCGRCSTASRWNSSTTSWTARQRSPRSSWAAPGDRC